VVVYSGNDAAPQVADASGGQAGQISSAVINSMKQKIREALETDKVAITDVYGDGRHVCIDVVSPLFAGQSSMQRQRMVYKVRGAPVRSCCE
jgi:stress-induced morphogen